MADIHHQPLKERFQGINSNSHHYTYTYNFHHKLCNLWGNYTQNKAVYKLSRYTYYSLYRISMDSFRRRIFPARIINLNNWDSPNSLYRRLSKVVNKLYIQFLLDSIMIDMSDYTYSIQR